MSKEPFIVNVRIDCANGRVHEFSYDWNNSKQASEAAGVIRLALQMGDRVTSTKEQSNG